MKNSSYIGMVFIGISILLSAIAQLLMKAGMLVLQEQNIVLVIPPTFDEVVLFIPALTWVLGGLFCYSVSVLCWMRALAQHELSLAYPLLSLSYALVYIGAVVWPRLNETISMTRIAGILFIFLGVLVVARTGQKQTE